MTHVVFDIGNVLVRWDPVPAFERELGSRAAVEAFLARVDFPARNLRADRGERFGALAQEIADPEDRHLFAAYPDRFARTVKEPIEGTWDLLHRLKKRGCAVHAITNWSTETWPIGLTMHPRLGDVFGVTVVSGHERVTKPERAIFDIFCARAGLAPQECLFIDDRVANVEGARAAGLAAHHFTTPEALEGGLTERGLL